MSAGIKITPEDYQYVFNRGHTISGAIDRMCMTGSEDELMQLYRANIEYLTDILDINRKRFTEKVEE